MDQAEAERAAATRAFVLGPYLNERGDPAAPIRSAAARVAEAGGLARAIDLQVVEESIVELRQIRPATYLGKGKVEEIAARVHDEQIALVFMDCALSPVQQRNLEKAFEAKVIDRTGLILEIFGRRARTREGSLQVELAHLEYQKSRLVRSWTHLERQRGGFGFLGGPARRRSRPTAGSSPSAWCASRPTSKRSSAPALCTARRGATCRTRSSRSSATPMPASPPSSTG